MYTTLDKYHSDSHSDTCLEKSHTCLKQTHKSFRWIPLEGTPRYQDLRYTQNLDTSTRWLGVYWVYRSLNIIVANDVFYWNPVIYDSFQQKVKKSSARNESERVIWMLFEIMNFNFKTLSILFKVAKLYPVFLIFENQCQKTKISSSSKIKYRIFS